MTWPGGWPRPRKRSTGRRKRGNVRLAFLFVFFAHTTRVEWKKRKKKTGIYFRRGVRARGGVGQAHKRRSSGKCKAHALAARHEVSGLFLRFLLLRTSMLFCIHHQPQRAQNAPRYSNPWQHTTISRRVDGKEASPLLFAECIRCWAREFYELVVNSPGSDRTLYTV